MPTQEPTPEVSLQPVAGTVVMLEGQGGNIGLCRGADGVVMVDTQYAHMAPKIQAALDTFAPKDLRFVVNTHWHGDHTGGNGIFGAAAPLVAHAKVRERMSKPASRAGTEQPPSPSVALPVVTFEDRVELHVNGERIEVRHVAPSHTDGDSIVWFHTSKVVHLGDTFFNGRFPFIDHDSGGSVRGLTAVIGELLKELPADVRLIPGHGPLASVKDLQSYHAMLVDVQRLVASALSAGKDAAAMKQDRVLSKYADLSWSFISSERFIDILVRDAQTK